VSGALGLLAFIVGLSLLVFMAFTIILIPITILGIILMLFAVIRGLVAFGGITGKYLVGLYTHTPLLQIRKR
jgi:uncharacterized membrane protein